ncbi:MAG: VOC family protein [Acidimicrobiales bacterium]|jgi:predicted enzyme related to lactoylglutathione lyase|nr:VOC family protein [Acidimicrobiales bacterium]
MQRSFFSVLSDDLPGTRDWYVALFDYRVDFDSDWFVQLQAPDVPRLELGIIARGHRIVPDALRSSPTGGLLTVVVDDVDALHQRAQQRGVEVLEPPTDLFYGQRRMLLVDPNGMIVDVSSECPPDPDWLSTLGG